MPEDNYISTDTVMRDRSFEKLTIGLPRIHVPDELAVDVGCLGVHHPIYPVWVKQALIDNG